MDERVARLKKIVEEEKARRAAEKKKKRAGKEVGESGAGRVGEKPETVLDEVASSSLSLEASSAGEGKPGVDETPTLPAKGRGPKAGRLEVKAGGGAAGLPPSRPSARGEKSRSRQVKKDREGGLEGSAGAAEALATLLELMNGSGSDSVRIAAAKVLLERAAETGQRGRTRKSEMSGDDRDDKRRRDEAVAAISRLLDELAALKVDGGRGAAELDTERKDGATDADG